MANKFTSAGTTVTFTTATETSTKISYSGGLIASVPGAKSKVTNAIAQAAYEAIKSSPVIIDKPAPGEAKEINNKDLAVLADIEKINFKLKPGIYAERSDWRNLKDVSIDGLGKVQFQTGRRAIQLNGMNFSGLTLSGMSFKNIQDYVIDVWGAGEIAYRPGVEGTFIQGLSLINLTADNCQSLFHINGSVQNGKQMGLIKDFSIKGGQFVNSSDCNNAIYIGNGMAYDISGMICDNLNTGVENHTAIFQLGGNGKLYNNKVTNHQGNAARAHLHSQEGVQTVDIFNNIVWNSRKYSAFEVQFLEVIKENKALPAKARIYNNTVGRMNTQLDWEGQILDKYSTGETVEFFGNLGFELNYVPDGSKPNITKPLPLGLNMVNMDQSKAKDNNVYVNTWKEGVTDLTTFKSLFPGVGATL